MLVPITMSLPEFILPIPVDDDLRNSSIDCLEVRPSSLVKQSFFKSRSKSDSELDSLRIREEKTGKSRDILREE
ncbi:hypothetical protein LENED_009073 [Lentinula edodes]|uniref:Uncharacterized protein n=1 Tax=Lentinula edodes TaxID=5353 RepID=A0A1Q3EIU8_LENED|nr:hypothetical protein LENED_009073 [Lentinula edodes]